MVPARGPGPELFYSYVPALDTPTVSIVLRQPPDVPEDVSKWHVRRERDEPLGRVLLVLVVTSSRPGEDDEVERGGFFVLLLRARVERVPRYHLPLPLRVLPESLLHA